MIYLEPNYGLANRMRVIASGLDLKESTGQRLTIVWPKTFELNCAFKDLFQPISNVRFIEKPFYFHLIKDNDQRTAWSRKMALISNSIFQINFCVKEDDGEKLMRGASKDAFSTVKKFQHVYIKTCGEFTKNNSLYSAFQPVRELQEIVNQRTKIFSKNTIGLHIRRTDHVDAIGNSPVELFIDVVEREFRKNSEINFYLSTDDPETEQRFKNEFGDIIITYKKDFSRNSLQGMKDALLDMYCLSRTSKIYGSFNSSFSDIASRINSIPLLIMTANKETRKFELTQP
ncbi:O-fucosyltransferase family protein [Flavitalea sp.]|nr:hypothetical protein [Flavitalea sp.]